MPTLNPVHYNSGQTFDYSISRNQLSFGVEDIAYGPTIQTGWYANTPIEGLIIVSDSYSQGLTDQANAYPIFWGVSANTQINLMNLINGLPARSGLTRFIEPGPAISWLINEGTYGIQNRTYEDIITGGLVLLYDPGTTLSYPLLGNYIYDLTSNNRTGILNNNIEFISSDGGVLNFSADSQQYISFSDVGNLSAFTVGCWFNIDELPTSSEFPTLVTNVFSAGTSINFALGFIEFPWTGKITGGFYNTEWYHPSGFTPTLNQWYYTAISFDGSQLKLYVNGYLYSQESTSAVASSSNLGGYVGRNWLLDYYIDGQIGGVQIYSSALTPTEIYQNFTSQAPRYGVPVPSPTPTSTKTPTPTPTPTVTPTHTITPTLTTTPTVTPTTTPITSFLDGAVMFIDGTNNEVYSYNSSANTITHLFSASSNNQIVDIGITDDKIFINDINGYIYEYDYISTPFVATLSDTYLFSGYTGSGMTAVDNNTILIASDNVYRLNLSAGTSETLFSLSGVCEGCVTNGDIIYNSVLDQYIINYVDTSNGTYYATLFGSSGNTITELTLSNFSGSSYTDLNSIRGLYTIDGIIYGMSYDLFIYNLGFDVQSVSTDSEPNNKTTEKVAGASGRNSQTAWSEYGPNFYYDVPVTPTPTVTITSSITPTPSHTVTKTPTPTYTATKTPTPTITPTTTIEVTPTVSRSTTPSI